MSNPRIPRFKGFFDPPGFFDYVLFALGLSLPVAWSRRQAIADYFRHWSYIIGVSVIMAGGASLMSMPGTFVSRRYAGDYLYGGTSWSTVSDTTMTQDFMPYLFMFLGSVAVVVIFTVYLEIQRLKRENASMLES